MCTSASERVYVCVHERGREERKILSLHVGLFSLHEHNNIGLPIMVHKINKYYCLVWQRNASFTKRLDCTFGDSDFFPINPTITRAVLNKGRSDRYAMGWNRILTLRDFIENYFLSRCIVTRKFTTHNDTRTGQLSLERKTFSDSFQWQKLSWGSNL